MAILRSYVELPEGKSSSLVSPYVPFFEKIGGMLRPSKTRFFERAPWPRLHIMADAAWRNWIKPRKDEDLNDGWLMTSWG